MTVSVEAVQRDYEARAEKIDVMAQRYGVRPRTLSDMARLLGWQRRRSSAGNTQQRRWTPAEEALLRAEYPTAALCELAARLDRRVTQVVSKANAMNLLRAPEVRVASARAAGSLGGRQAKANRDARKIA